MRTEAIAVPSAVPRAPALTHRASLNTLQTMLDYGAKLLVDFVVTPILVAGLGRSLYGVWEMLNRLIGYMAASDARPTEALRLVVAARQGLDDPAGHRRAVGSALVVWVIFLPLVIAVGSVLVWLAPILAKASTDLRTTVHASAALLVLGFLATALATVPESVLRGMNLGYKRMGLQAALSVLSGVLLALAVRRGFGLTGAAASQVIVAIATGLCFWLLARRYVPWFGVARPHRSEIRAMLGMSGWMAGGELIAHVSLASDVLILGAVVSPATVTTYVLTGYAARLVVGLHYRAATSAMPGLGGVLGGRQFERAAELRRELLILSWLFSTALGAAILMWNRSFLALWVGPQLYAGFWVNLLIVLITIQTALLRSDAFVLDAALRPRERVITSVVAAVLVLGVGIALAHSYGMVGMCVGLLVGRAVQSVAYPILIHAALGRARRIPWRPLLRPALATVLILGIAALLGEGLHVRGWIAWTGLVGVSVAVLLPATFLAGVARSDRHHLMARLRTIRRGMSRG